MANAPRKPASPEARIARAIGRACFTAIAKQNNPGMSKDELKKIWTDSKKEYIKLGKRVARQISKRGYKIEAPSA